MMPPHTAFSENYPFPPCNHNSIDKVSLLPGYLTGRSRIPRTQRIHAVGWLEVWVGVAAFAMVREVRLTSNATPTRTGQADNELRRYVFTPAPEATTRNRPQAQYFSRKSLGPVPAIQPCLEDGAFAPTMPSGKVVDGQMWRRGDWWRSGWRMRRRDALRFKLQALRYIHSNFRSKLWLPLRHTEYLHIYQSRGVHDAVIQGIVKAVLQ